MRSETSLFSPAVGRKSFVRYWPVWATYLAIWLLLLPVSIPSDRYSGAREIPEYCDNIVKTMAQDPAAILTALFSIFAAMAVWSYLMNPRAAAFYHALPVKREGLFLTQYLTGLGFLAVPACLTALLTFLSELIMGYTGGGGVVLQWLAAVMLMSFFFFSLATFCAFLTGHMVALPILYGLLNAAVIVLEYLLRKACEIFYRGVEVGAPRLAALSPIVGLFEWNSYLSGNRGEIQFYFDYLGWLAFAAVVLTTCAFLLCKYRHTESAGDVIAVGFLRPVFRYAFALGCSVVLGSIFFAVLNINYGGWSGTRFIYIACLLAGGAIGYLAAEMLLQKRFRILRRSWKGLCALLAVTLVLSLAVSCDMFGVERWMPDVGDVKEVRLNGNTFTEPEDIEKIITLHSMTIEAGEEPDGGFTQIAFIYVMQDGGIVRRRYDAVGSGTDITNPGTPVGLCAELLNGEKAICSRVLPPEGARVQYVTLSIYGDSIYGDRYKDGSMTITLSTQDYAGLFAALRADAAQGTLDNWNGYFGYSDCVTNMHMVWYYTDDTQTGNRDFAICSDDLNTLAFLKNKGYLEK